MTKRRTRRNPFVFLQVDGTPVETYDLDTTPLTAADLGAYTSVEVDDLVAACVPVTGTGANSLSVATAASGSFPVIAPTGADTNISVGMFPKAAGTFRLGGDSPTITLTNSAQANLGLTVVFKGNTNGGLKLYVPSGQTPTVTADGNDTNHDLNLVGKGSGVVKANGVEVVTLSGTQTETNKTFTSPKINSVKDTNGNAVLDFITTASAVNNLQATNAAASSYPDLAAVGSDTNIHIGITPKGAGQLRLGGSDPTIVPTNSGLSNLGLTFVMKGTGSTKIYAPTGQTPTLRADGADSNHDLSLFAKGTGVIKGNAVVQLVNVTAPAGTPSASGYLYVESGALKFKGSGGTVTTVAPA